MYVSRRHGPFRGLMTLVLALWAIAYPGVLLLLAAFGPIGIVIGIGTALLLFVPWLSGLVILGCVRWLT